MATILLAHPSERCPLFQVFCVYEAPNVHRVFALEEIGTRDEAEPRARQMMQTYDADHFQRVIEVSERTG